MATEDIQLRSGVQLELHSDLQSDGNTKNTSLPPLGNSNHLTTTTSPIVIPSEPFVVKERLQEVEHEAMHIGTNVTHSLDGNAAPTDRHTLDQQASSPERSIKSGAPNPLSVKMESKISENKHVDNIKLPSPSKPNITSQNKGGGAMGPRTYSSQEYHANLTDDSSTVASNERGYDYSQTVPTRSIISSQQSDRYPAHLFKRGATTLASYGERSSEFPEMDERQAYTSIDVISHRCNKTYFPSLKQSSNPGEDAYFTPYRYQMKRHHEAREPSKSDNWRDKLSEKTVVPLRVQTSHKMDARTLHRMNKARITDTSKSNGRARTDKSIVHDEIYPKSPEIQNGSVFRSTENIQRTATRFHSPRIKRGVTNKTISIQPGYIQERIVNDTGSYKIYPYRDQADITDPIDFIHSHRGDTADEYQSDYADVQSQKLRISKLTTDIRTDPRDKFKLKPSVLRKLKSIMKNKGTLGKTPVSEFMNNEQQMDDIKFLHLGYHDETAQDTSRLRGGKVQRGTFLTKHSKWIRNARLNEAERDDYPTVVKLGTPQSAPKSNPDYKNHHEMQAKPAYEVVAQPMKPPAPTEVDDRTSPTKSVYKVKLGDSTVLVIDHDKKRAAMESKYRESLNQERMQGRRAHFDRQNSIGEGSLPNSRLWVPPNTPHYDELCRYRQGVAGAQEIDKFQVMDEFGRTVSRMYSVDEGSHEQYQFEHQRDLKDIN